MTRQAVQRVANELVGDGLMDLDANPDHRTSPLLRLTKAGHNVLIRINKSAAIENTQLAQTLGPNAVRDTRKDVRLLTAALRD